MCVARKISTPAAEKAQQKSDKARIFPSCQALPQLRVQLGAQILNLELYVPPYFPRNTKVPRLWWGGMEGDTPYQACLTLFQAMIFLLGDCCGNEEDLKKHGREFERAMRMAFI